MCPRPYSLGKRKEASDRIRTKVVDAARKLLMARNGLTEFNMESVARKAGVTRLTVYNQFGSKIGLLEHVYDDIGRSGGIADRLLAAFEQKDPMDCLDAVVKAFIGFWDAERLALRRLRSMAVLNPDFKGVTERDKWRRNALATALARVMDHRGSARVSFEDTLDTLTMLTSFEAFDTLSRNGTPLPKIVGSILSLVHMTIGNAET